MVHVKQLVLLHEGDVCGVRVGALGAEQRQQHEFPHLLNHRSERRRVGEQIGVVVNGLPAEQEVREQVLQVAREGTQDGAFRYAAPDDDIGAKIET